jgi:hypothetical protein
MRAARATSSSWERAGAAVGAGAAGEKLPWWLGRREEEERLGADAEVLLLASARGGAVMGREEVVRERSGRWGLAGWEAESGLAGFEGPMAYHAAAAARAATRLPAAMRWEEDMGRGGLFRRYRI